jgi:pterin-4a-carbinolamine dehydratase
VPKKREGDEQRRAHLARDARRRGDTPSGSGVTLGSSKQFEHEERAHRSGPSGRAGERKLTAEKPIPPTPPRPSRIPPKWDPAAVRADPNPGELSYRDVISEVGRRARLDFERARAATASTVTALARLVDEPDRSRLLWIMPAGLYGEEATQSLDGGRNLTGFVAEVARLAGEPPEQALLQAQTVLGVIDERDGGLLRSLPLPDDIRGLTGAAPTGGGLTGPAGQTPPLTGDELRAALDDLPYWSCEGRALCRTIQLPRENLDRVLQWLAGLESQPGRGPHIGRVDETTATLVVRTLSVDAVTRLDVDLAHRVDAAIEEVGASIA